MGTMLLMGAGGGGAAPFTPLTLPGVQMVLTADAGIGVATGNKFATWADQTPNGNSPTQATGANQATFQAAFFNGQNVVQFTAASTTFMQLSAFASGALVGPWYIYSYALMTSGALYDSASSFNSLLFDTAGSYAYYNGTQINITAADGGADVVGLLMPAGGITPTVRINGSVTSYTGTNLSSTTLTGFLLGSQQAQVRVLQGWIRKMVVGIGTLTAPQIASLEAWMLL